MGLLVEGKWKNEWYDTKSTGGKFERKAPSFRNWITKDGSATTVDGPGGCTRSHYYALTGKGRGTTPSSGYRAASGPKQDDYQHTRT